MSQIRCLSNYARYSTDSTTCTCVYCTRSVSITVGNVFGFSEDPSIKDRWRTTHRRIGHENAFVENRLTRTIHYGPTPSTVQATHGTRVKNFQVQRISDIREESGRVHE